MGVLEQFCINIFDFRENIRKDDSSSYVLHVYTGIFVYLSTCSDILKSALHTQYCLCCMKFQDITVCSAHKKEGIFVVLPDKKYLSLIHSE